jgi:hypothetical protein
MASTGTESVTWDSTTVHVIGITASASSAAGTIHGWIATPTFWVMVSVMPAVWLLLVAGTMVIAHLLTLAVVRFHILPIASSVTVLVIPPSTRYNAVVMQEIVTTTVKSA